MQGASSNSDISIWQRLFGDWTPTVTPTTLLADALAVLLGGALVCCAWAVWPILFHQRRCLTLRPALRF